MLNLKQPKVRMGEVAIKLCRFDGGKNKKNWFKWEKSMTKADLVAALEKQAKLTHKQSETVINITFDACIRALYDDDRIEIRGFGSFANRNYKAYTGRNPKTGLEVTVPPKKVPFFKVGKELKDMVDKGKDKYHIREA